MLLGRTFREFFLSLARKLKVIAARKLARLGEREFQEGKITAAIGRYRKALRLFPDFPEACNNLGIALQFSGKANEARLSFEHATRLAPHFGEAHYNLALIYLEQQQAALAEVHLGIAKQKLGNSAYISAGYGRLATLSGNTESALEHFREALLAAPSFKEAADSYLLALSASEAVSPDELRGEHIRVSQKCYAPPKDLQRVFERNCDPHRQLTIGYLSPDFREHSVRYFIEGILRNHDRSQFRIICYHDSTRSDAITETFKSLADVWHEIAGKPDSHVARLIGSDKLDILVELAGHTTGNRLAMVAQRVAPIQISGLGYPPTTGVPAIDYKLSDAIADPPGADQYYSEKLLRLPGCFWCYTPPEDCPDVAAAPCTLHGEVTFGCFGNTGKISNLTLIAWKKILEASPHARLLVKSANLGNTWSDNLFLQRMIAIGLDSSRVSLEGPSIGREYLNSYNRIDLILDTYPYNGGTTTAHALWMSVPVLTLAGELLLSRMGTSMLSACKHPELIADSWDDYIGKAISLAHDKNRLLKLREDLRQDVARSLLVDGSNYVNELQRAYKSVWRLWCEKTTGRKPES